MPSQSINTNKFSAFNQSYSQGYGKKSATVSFFTPVLFSFLSSPLHVQKILSYLLEQWLQALNSTCLSFFFSFNLYNWVVCSCFSVSLVGPGKTNSNKMPTEVPSTVDDVRQENYKIDRSHFSQFMLIIFFSVNTFYKITSRTYSFGVPGFVHLLVS